MQDDRLDNIALFKHFCSKNTNLTSTEKLIAIILLSHRNNISMMCCPGLSLLVKETKLNRRTIQRSIMSLIKKKELSKLKIISGKLYIKSQYYFLYDIDTAKEIYENDESLFSKHHDAEVDNFKHCLGNRFF